MRYIADIYAPRCNLHRESLYFVGNNMGNGYDVTILDDNGNKEVIPLVEVKKSDALGVVRIENYSYFYTVDKWLLKLLEITDGLELCEDFDTSTICGSYSNYVLYDNNRLVVIVRNKCKKLDDLGIFWLRNDTMMYTLLDLYLLIYSYNIDFQGYTVYAEFNDEIYKVDINKKIDSFLAKFATLGGSCKFVL